MGNTGIPLPFGFPIGFPSQKMMSEAIHEPDPVVPMMNANTWRSLRWPLFGPLTDIVVMDDASDAHSPLSPLFGQPNGHQPTSQIATDPPRSRMLFSCWAVDMYGCECTENPIPSPLLISNPSGQPISIGDIITSLHPYLSIMESVIREVFNSKADFYFDGFEVVSKSKAGDDDLEFGVRVKEDERDMEEHWEAKAGMLCAQREDLPPKDDKARTMASISQLLAFQAERITERKASSA